MRTAMVSLLVVLLLPLTAWSADRIPVPDRADQVEAFKQVRATHEQMYKKKDPEVQRLLARKLLGVSGREEIKPAAAYVMLRESARLAVEGEDPELMMECTARLCARFEVDSVQTRLDLLEELRPKLKMGEGEVEMTAAYVEVIRDALKQDRFDEIDEAKKKSAKYARAARDHRIAETHRALLDRAAYLGKAYAARTSAQKMLELAPDDPVANLTMGDYYGFVKQDWPRALPLLAKGSDPALRDLAEKEFAKPTQEADLRALGDGYWDRAQTVEDKRAKAQVLRRSAHWYQQALALGPSTLEAVQVEERLKTIIDLLRITDGIELAEGEIPPGAVLLLTFDEEVKPAGYGSTLREQGPHKLTTTVVTPRFEDGVAGKCFVLGGREGLTFAWGEPPQIPGELTLSFWYKRDKIKVNKNAHVAPSSLLSIVLEDRGANNFWYIRELGSNTRVVGWDRHAQQSKYKLIEGKFLFRFSEKEFWKLSWDLEEKISGAVDISVDRLNDGEWHHIVALFDGTRARLYLDGRSRGSDKIKDVGPLKDIRFHISHGTTGKLDELVLYGRALSLAEVGHLYRFGQKGKRLMRSPAVPGGGTAQP